MLKKKNMNDKVDYLQEVQPIVGLLLSKVKDILGDDFVGLYLHGSLALRDFAPNRSDIDFAVVVKEGVSDLQVDLLRRAHEEILLSGLKYADRLEGGYFPKSSLNNYVKNEAFYPTVLVGGGFEIDGYGRDWIIQEYVIRENGIIIEGPDPKRLIKPIDEEDLRLATIGVLDDWWKPQVYDHSRIQESEYQAYAVLTMCRILYALQTGKVGSKSQAAAWASENLDNDKRCLIREALNWEKGKVMSSLNDTVNLIKLTLDSAGISY